MHSLKELCIIQVLQNARSQLLQALQQNLTKASGDGDDQAVLRFIKLYGPLGAEVSIVERPFPSMLKASRPQRY